MVTANMRLYASVEKAVKFQSTLINELNNWDDGSFEVSLCFYTVYLCNRYAAEATPANKSECSCQSCPYESLSGHCSQKVDRVLLEIFDSSSR